MKRGKIYYNAEDDTFYFRHCGERHPIECDADEGWCRVCGKVISLELFV